VPLRICHINNANGITNTPYTGRSGGEPNTAHKYDLQQGYVGNYSYNDNTCLKGQTLCTGEKIPNAGTGASTTGNIYGIYDMNGGREEYVMGINLGTGTCPNIGTYIYQNKQYYDEFNSGTNYRIIYGTATDETKSWYNDSYSRSTTFNCTVEYRGGSSKNEDSSAAKDDGIFSVGYGSYNTGSATVLNGYRVTLIP